MKKIYINRIISLLLIFTLLFTAFPVNSLTTLAADATHVVDATTAANRTNSLVNALVGKYFTTTQTNCGNSKCDKCKNSNVICASWLKSTMGLVPDYVSLLPEHFYSSSGTVTSTAWSCAGFANYCMWYIYAQNPSDNVRITKVYSGTFTKNNMDNSGVRTGDIVRVDGHHSFIYISHNSSGVTVLDSNWDTSRNNLVQKHVISWSWRSGTTMAITRGKNWSGTHTHSYSGKYYEAAHPHRYYQQCSCGKTQTISGNATVSSCSQCTMTVDSKYNTVKGFKSYPCVTSNFEVKTSDLTTRGGEIYTTDYCTINEIYTNGWCKVTFPMDTGGTRTAYTQISKFIKSPSTSMGSFKSESYINLYSTSSLSTKIFRIYPNDVCYTIGTSGSATQVFMPHSDGYYVLGWIQTSEIPSTNSYDIETRYPTPFKCRVLSSTKVPAALSVGGERQSDMNVYVDDDCVITEVYKNGWCKFTCPWSDGSTKTLYLPLSEFINANIEPYTFKATQYTDTYYKSDKATKVGWIDVGDSVTVVSKNGNVSQAIYPADVGKRCGWANTSALTANYTITYNANGGSSAPSSQTKTPGTSLTLSTSKPTKTGYVFVGWATSASATNAEYLAGSIYTEDKNVTLYAVWRKQTFTITYNANTGENAPGIQTQTYGTAIIVTDEIPSKAYTVSFDANEGELDTDYYSYDCTFAEWNTNPDGTGTTVLPESEYTPNANVTLYAIYDNPLFENYPIPTREGYVFNGWCSTQTGETAFNSGTEITADTTLYAQWEKETYSIVYFDEESSSILYEQSKTNGIDIQLLSTIPEKSGYTFKGWSTQEASNEVSYLPGATYTEEESIILYAVWEKSGGEVVNIEISSEPNKLNYEIGDTFDQTGLTVKLIYNDSTNEIITDGFTVSAPDMSTAGTKEVIVSYGEISTSFNITVLEPEVSVPKYSISNVIGRAGESVEVYISIEGNPGIISLRNQISYDTSALDLVKIENLGLLSGYTTPSPTITSPYTLRWADSFATENNIANGNIVKLTFSIKEGSPVGEYEISVTPVEARNVNGEKIEFAQAKSKVTVIDYITGDIDDDGEITDWDAIVLNRYLSGWEVDICIEAADVDKDGEITDWDAIILERYLAGWNVEIG